jgi:hypothetical protein
MGNQISTRCVVKGKAPHLHHRVRLELRAEPLVHPNQPVFVVNVEPAVFAFLFLVPAVHHDRGFPFVRQTHGGVVLELVVLQGESLQRAPRRDQLAPQRKRHGGAQVKHLHVRAQGIILRDVQGHLLPRSVLLVHRSS